jgi:hypothetical protein
VIHLVVEAEAPPAGSPDPDELLRELARVIARLRRENGRLRGCLNTLAACPKVISACPACCSLLCGAVDQAPVAEEPST